MRYRTVLLGMSVVLAVPVVARADDGVAQLQRQYSMAVMQWSNRSASQPQSRPAHPVLEYMPRFRQFVEDHAGKPEAIPALNWILANAPMAARQPDDLKSTLEWVVVQIIVNHAKDAAVADLLPTLNRYAGTLDRQILMDLYQRLAKDNPNRRVQAGGLFSQANLFMSAGEFSPADKKRGLELLHKVAADYKDTDVGQQADSLAFEIEHLQVGSEAPEIEGENENGEKIRLSQFRGQVVLLDFWGFW